MSKSVRLNFSRLEWYFMMGSINSAIDTAEKYKIGTQETKDDLINSLKALKIKLAKQIKKQIDINFDIKN